MKSKDFKIITDFVKTYSASGSVRLNGLYMSNQYHLLGILNKRCAPGTEYGLMMSTGKLIKIMKR